MAEKIKAAKPKKLDFTDVKDSGGRFNTKRQTAGDYRGKVLSVEDSPTKETGEPQWLFTVQVGSGVYPYRCKLVPNQLWKVRNMFVAAGLPAPKKKETVDPAKVVGANIGVTLEDDEYNGKAKSNVASVFPESELEGANTPEDEGDEESEEPKAKKKKGKKDKKMKELDIAEM